MTTSIADVLIRGQENVSQESADPMGVPQFKQIKEKFQKALDNNTPILIENADLNLTHSVVIELDYVGDRWCRGYTTYHRADGSVKVPYTISYSEVYIGHGTQGKNSNIIFKGDNPYG